MFVSFSELALALNKQLYGQHLVRNTVVAAIRGHLDNPDPPHPLVISFHGPTGTGKNYVSKLVAGSLYKEGLKSKYVHLKIATRHFPHREDINKYKVSFDSIIFNNFSLFCNQLSQVYRMQTQITKTLCHKDFVSQRLCVTKTLCHKDFVSQRLSVTKTLCHKDFVSQCI